MASRKFRFVSPGVFLREIDNSQLPGLSDAVGPIIIGRTRRGPAMKPYKVRSLEELERVFGKPLPGNEGQGDPWRDGTGLLAEAYAPYAAKAYLNAARGTDSPVTMVRLLGIQGDDASDIDAAKPGWKTETSYGLFLMASGSNMAEDSSFQTSSLELAAIWYSTDASASLKLKGTDFGGNAGATGSIGIPIKMDASEKFTIQLSSSDRGSKDIKFAFSDIRKDFNTNPASTNTRISTVVSGTLSDKFFLGESFQDVYDRKTAELASKDGNKLGAVILELNSKMSDFKGASHELQPARTGWVFGQDTRLSTASFAPEDHQKLFRIIALHEGVESTKGLIVGIEDIQVARPGATNRFGKFSVCVKRIGNARLEILERFDNCNLDPSSPDFVARKIGDQHQVWSPTEKRNKLSGEHPNVSEYIRVEMNQDVASNGPTNVEHVPFGFFGPIRPKTLLGTANENAAREVSKLTIPGGAISDGAFNAGANGHQFTLKTVDNSTGLAFKYDKDLAPAAAKASNAAGQANASAPVIGVNGLTTVTAIASAVKDAIEGSTLASGVTVSYTEGEAFITITQVKAGVVTEALAESSIYFTAETVTEGVNPGPLDPSFTGDSNWVKGTLALSSGSVYGNNTTKAIEIKWPQSLITNTSSATQGHYQGASPYKYTYDYEDSSALSHVGSRISREYVDHYRRLPNFSSVAADQLSGVKSVNSEYSYIFSLDEVILKPSRSIAKVGSITSNGDIKEVVYSPGSRTGASDSGAGGTDTIKSYGWHIANGTGSVRTLLDVVEGFYMPLDGGFDGVDIVEPDPFNANVLNNQSTATSYAYSSVDRALELIKDPEAVEHNLALMPGITEESLTTKLVDFCEARADSLAIIDLPDVYKPPFQEKCDNFQDRIVATPESAARDLTNRQLNSSYGASYYPWVKIKDETANRDVWVPPSVVALGVMGYTERSSEVWFAPAGFNRGGLNSGNAGVPVLQVTEQLLSKDRDTLYAANINPIASFVSEGLVVFGQKTLQSEQSALDRINVRRLLIFVKKEVSRISSELLFEQNLQATWNRFHGQVKSFLESVKVRFGLTDFKVLLDSTTTTPDLIDRNIMYAKIFLKPARSIEFIAVDFVITNTGASFDD